MACAWKLRMRRFWQSPTEKMYMSIAFIMLVLLAIKVIELATRKDLFNYGPGEMADYHGGVDQEDPDLIEYVRANILKPPLPVPYNLQFPSGHPKNKQIFEHVVQFFLKNKTHGIFFEAGANDGEEHSKTLMLEKNFGWTGLLVEPDSNAFKTLTLKRRKAWISNACVALEKRLHNVSFMEYADSTASKISQMGYRWDPEDLAGRGVRKHCVPLFTLVTALNMKVIDFLSLDAGGADFDILQTIPFDKLKIKIISLQHQPMHFPHGNSGKLRNFMHEKDFYGANEVVPRVILDYFFVHKSILNAEQLKMVDRIKQFSKL